MDDTSDAAKADSGLQPDGKALVEEYQEPNSAYPHASSLRSLQGIVSPKDQPEYDFRDNNDMAVQYVHNMNDELRVTKSSHAEAMTEYMQLNYEAIVAFVRQYRLYDDSMYKGSPGSGSGRTQRVLMMEKRTNGDFGQVPVEPASNLEENELVELYAKSIRGGGNALGEICRCSCSDRKNTGNTCVWL